MMIAAATIALVLASADRNWNIKAKGEFEQSVWGFTIYLIYLADYLRGRKNRKTELKQKELLRQWQLANTRSI